MIPGILLCCMAALLPAVMLYFPNMEEIPLTGMLPYFGIMAGIGVLAWAGMYLVFRRKGLAAVAAAVWLLVLLNVGRLVPVIRERWPLAGIRIFAPVTLVFLALATFGLSRLSEDFLGDAVKVMCLALAAFILTTAVPQFFRSPETGEEEEETEAVSRYDLTPAEGTDRPNIYWILADEYAGLDQLEKYYHYDNSPFYDRLREMGFTVSDHSYNWSTDTYTILRDIMSLNYTKSPGKTMAKRRAVTDRDLPLWTMLRSLGYEVCEAESTNKFRLVNRLQKEIVDDSPRTADGSAVANLLLKYSLLYRYENEILRVLAPSMADATAKEAVLNVFRWAEDPESIHLPGPSFTLIYVKCPHEPFVFDRNGNGVAAENQKNVKDKKYYLDQLIFATKHLEKICVNITAEDPDAIVVLQSDHGHRFVDNGTYLDISNVMNAVYFRGQPIDGVENMNALNTWRAVMRKQFRLDLPEVKEKRLKNKYRPESRDPKAEDPNEGEI